MSNREIVFSIFAFKDIMEHSHSIQTPEPSNIISDHTSAFDILTVNISSYKLDVTTLLVQSLLFRIIYILNVKLILVLVKYKGKVKRPISYMYVSVL